MPAPGSTPSHRTADFDTIGTHYSRLRRADPRLTTAIGTALDHASSILNIGAGAGSYEPDHVTVVAVEPSMVMLGQHPGRRRVQAVAEALPFASSSFDASMATLTVHHWSDLRRGLREMQRVSRRQVVFTWDPDHEQELWLHSEYLPEMAAIERSRFPALDQVVEFLGAHQVVAFSIPHDFTDGFQHAFWRRPESFLDPRVRAASSLFAVTSPGLVDPALEQLRADLASGAWTRRHRDLLDRPSVDYGYRIVIAGEDLGSDHST
jgi:SAM-dependent methyltransferase